MWNVLSLRKSVKVWFVNTPTQKTHTIHTIIGVYHYTYHHSHMAFSWETPNHQKTPSFGYPTINHPPRCHAEPRSVAVDLEIHLHLLEATNHPIPLCQSQSYSLLHSCHFQRCSPKHPAPQEDTPWMLSSWETCQHCQRKLVEKVREFGSQGLKLQNREHFTVKTSTKSSHANMVQDLNNRKINPSTWWQTSTNKCHVGIFV